ncbi:MAG: hypothetical protein HYR64_03880 [Fimbriimonas ginsengisoli]|uniref:Neutral/alkaline non-lysosomal ceramidase N-terminal domain-containing protein n=1 Tax=Fimbriimonas ginsengisoli TaxID=1005039 RepID=A0A931LRZ2_FIMGI|nr:hypothetical protein [Fimbriimonas ginsengisoli]MBI3744828.1 hypothetical protein [Chloroflexota bacterium]
MIFGALVALQAASPLLLRTAIGDLTPPGALPLGGYTARGGRLSKPGGDRLFVRVAVLEQDKTRLAIASCELLTVPESLVREVRSRLPNGVELFLCATHTHCAPDSQMLNERMTFPVPGISTYRPAMLTWYADAVASAIRRGLEATPAELRRVSVAAASLPLNRGRRPGAKPDPTGYLVEGLTADGATVPIFACYAAHAVFYGPEEMHTRGDWPGALARCIGAPVLMGALGDVSPAAPGATPRERVDNFVGRFLTGIAGAPRRIAWVSEQGNQFPDAAVHLLVGRSHVALDTVSPHPTFARVYGTTDRLASTIIEAFAPNEAYLSAFRLGRLEFVGVPGEPSSGLGDAIRTGLRPTLEQATVLVASHVNGWMGYLLSPQDYDRGGYEATLSFYGRLEGERIVYTATRGFWAIFVSFLTWDPSDSP